MTLVNSFVCLRLTGLCRTWWISGAKAGRRRKPIRALRRSKRSVKRLSDNRRRRKRSALGSRTSATTVVEDACRLDAEMLGPFPAEANTA